MRQASVLSRLEADGVDVPRLRLRGPGGLALAGDGATRYVLGAELERTARTLVVSARDVDLGREVAMTILREERARSPDALARFLAEARVAGGLQHPGVLPVYEIGRLDDGRPFFTTKLPRGETLEAVLAAHEGERVDRRRLLGIFEQACQTLAFAHAQGVAHGGLDARRVIVGRYGDVHVAGWGLHAGAEKRSDVRALGALLARILTCAQEGEADPCALASVGTDAALGALARRCLEAEVEDAGAVAADVAAYRGETDERAHRLELTAIQERAAAERARERAAAAQAAAGALRRARRQTVALAGALLLLLLAACAAWWWIDAGRRERAARAAGVVEALLRESARLEGEGRPADALAAATRAHALTGGDEVARALRERAQRRAAALGLAVTEATAAAEREARERALEGVLREIRARRGIDPPAVTAAAYARALTEYGLPLDAADSEVLRRDPQAEVLRRALRDWARVPAGGLESGPPALVAATATAAREPAPSVEDLREAWWRRPGDLELNLELAERLLAADPPRAQDGLGHLTVATALAPDCAGIWVRLGDACGRAGDTQRAAQAYRCAAELDPGWDVPRARRR